jgi:hypothetical protein
MICRLQSSRRLQHSFVKNLISALSSFWTTARKLSDIVKRRSTRVLRAAVKLRVARSPGIFGGLRKVAGDAHVGKA